MCFSWASMSNLFIASYTVNLIFPRWRLHWVSSIICISWLHMALQSQHSLWLWPPSCFWLEVSTSFKNCYMFKNSVIIYLAFLNICRRKKIHLNSISHTVETISVRVIFQNINDNTSFHYLKLLKSFLMHSE